VSCWVYFATFATSNNCIVHKEYRASGARAAPYISFGIDQYNAAGRWQVEVAIAGTAYVVLVTSALYLIQAQQWTHLAMTYDGVTLRAYINGQLAGTTSIVGAADMGTHGPYYVGGVTNGATGSSDCIVDDVRVESTVRSKAYLRAQYAQGVGLL
jgi:hypothetical protein